MTKIDATELEEIRQECKLLSQTDLTCNDPRVRAWMERAANCVRRDQLKPGQRFAVDELSNKLKKVFVN